MANAVVKTTNGKKVILHRSYTPNASLSSTLYTEPKWALFGTDQATSNVSDTDLTRVIPVYNGTVIFNCSAAFTGSSGGDNSTNNTSIFKEGAGQIDATAQNLIANGTNVNKIWTREPTTANWVGTSFAGFWLYIKDSATLAKMVSVTLRAGADSSNYWSKQWLNAVLTTGWNWLTTGVLNTNTPTGTVTGTLDYAAIVIVTNNSADTFVAGDVAVDLLRQWTETDTLVAFDATYPQFDYTGLTVTRQVTLNSAMANGFNISGFGNDNNDTTKLLTDSNSFGADSKGSTDEFIYVLVDRVK